MAHEKLCILQCVVYFTVCSKFGTLVIEFEQRIQLCCSMSRCFPFPPPGYERKLRVDDDNLLLVKEKDKEKKHKRDKNKEKKDGKERDKDKSKDRHREKDKEKKEKHKHKNKDKKNDKSQWRDERVGSSNSERVGSNSPRNHFTVSSSAQDLGQRIISYVGIATRIQNAVKINDRDHGRGELLEKPRFDQMANGQTGNGETRLPNVAVVCSSDGVDKKRAEIRRPMEIDRPIEEKQRIEKGVQNREKNGKRFDGQGIQINRPNDTAFVQELGRRISAENGAGGRQVFARPDSTNQKRIDSNGTFANCDKAMPSHSSQSKEISNFGNGINRKDGVPKVEATHKFNGLGHAMVRPVDMDKSASVQGMGRNSFSSGVGAMGHNEKKGVNSDDFRNKAKIEKVERGGGNIVNITRSGSDYTELTEYTNRHALQVSNKSLLGVAANKRKEPEANGFLHDDGVRPIKLPRRVMSPQSDTEGGRNLKHSATITLCASNHQAPTPDSLRLYNKESKVVENVVCSQQSPPFSTKPSPLVSSKSPSSVVDANGTISAHESPLGSTKPMSKKSKSKDRERDGSSKIPSPHPDTKYLSEIYSIPKIDDWSESNDDEWLSSSKRPHGSKEVNTGSLTNDDGQPQVWDKAINIESLDFYALPYVISC